MVSISGRHPGVLDLKVPGNLLTGGMGYPAAVLRRISTMASGHHPPAKGTGSRSGLGSQPH